MNEKRHPLHEAECLRTDAEQLERKYLEKLSWEWTSSTPGSFWLYIRTDKHGNRWTATHSLALSMSEVEHWWRDD